MAITFVNHLLRRGLLTARLDDAVAVLLGTHTPPVKRTGIITAQLDPATAVITGVVSPAQNRTGTLVATLDAATAVLNGTFVVAAQTKPGAPTAVTATASTLGLVILFKAPTVIGATPLTRYTATLSPGGQTFTSDALTSPVQSGPSCRIDATGLIAGTSYTATVTAANASGTGVASATSNAAIPTPATDYYVANGGAVDGRNAAWGDVSFPGPGGVVDWLNSDVAPLSGTHVVKMVTTQPFGGLLPFKINTLGSGNGRFDVSPYAAITVAIRPTQANQKLEIYCEQSVWINGVATAGGPQTFTDATQNWIPGQLVGFLVNDITTGSTQNTVIANTATTVTVQAGGPTFAAGHSYELQQPDVAEGVSVLLGAGSTLYGPATMVVGQWNPYTIPITAFGFTNLRILKFALHDQSGNATTLYFDNLGFKAPVDPPPSVPTGLIATPASSTQINLSWNASTDT